MHVASREKEKATGAADDAADSNGVQFSRFEEHFLSAASADNIVVSRSSHEAANGRLDGFSRGD